MKAHAFTRVAVLATWAVSACVCAATLAHARPPFHPLASAPAAAQLEQVPSAPTPEQLRDATVPGSYDRPVVAAGADNGGHAFDAIAGKTWRLVTLGGDSLDAATRAPTITFEGTRVSGFGGCNRYSGEAKKPAVGVLEFSAIAATQMACEPTFMELESKYFAALQAATRYSIDDERLVLSSGHGSRAQDLVFVKTGEPLN